MVGSMVYQASTASLLLFSNVFVLSMTSLMYSGVYGITDSHLSLTA